MEIEELAQESRLTVAKAKEELLVLAEHERVDRQKQAVIARRRAALADVVAGRPVAAEEPAEPSRDVGHRADPRAGAATPPSGRCGRSAVVPRTGSRPGSDVPAVRKSP